MGVGVFPRQDEEREVTRRILDAGPVMPCTAGSTLLGVPPAGHSSNFGRPVLRESQPPDDGLD